jgi:L-lactate dehydrogenase complex protein LldG
MERSAVNAEAFLANVRIGVDARRLADPGPEPSGAPEPGLVADLLSTFRSNLETVGGVLHEPKSAAESCDLVIEIIGTTGATRYLSWDGQHLPLAGLLDRMSSAGLRRMSDIVPWDAASRREHQDRYFDCAVGVTGASAGLADTGSIVLKSGPGRPRMASLIPETHIALLQRTALHASLAAWLVDQLDALDSAANWTIITGPSRTADIEMVVTLGVHGPRSLHVVLV